MPTTAQHIAARRDADLMERAVAVAEMEGVPGAQQWAEAHMGEIVNADVGGSTIADVHAYAVATYEPTPRPGQNLAAVTDEQLVTAVQAVRAEDDHA